MHKGIIGFLIFLVFNYIILVFVVDYSSSDDSKNYKEELKTLKNRNQQLKSKNATMHLKITELKETNVGLKAKLKVEKQITTQIKTERDEKVDDIDGMDNNGLYGFFSNFKTDSINGQFRY